MKQKYVYLLLLILFALVLYVSYYIPVKNYVLPKIIWSYWNDYNIPKDLQLILAHRKQVLNSYKHIVLYDDTISDYIDELPPSNYDKLTSPAHKADWLRLALLKKHGGCWMDVSIIVNDAASFDTLYEKAQQNRAELSAFYFEAATYRGDPYTYIENWLLIAPQNSPLIIKWHNEFCYAISVGFDRYRKQVVHRLKNSDNIDTYLTQHATLQIVLQDLWFTPNIMLHRAEDTMFRLGTECKQYESNVNACIMNKIRTDHQYVRNIPFIKLTSSMRTTGIDISSYFQ